MLAHFYKYKEVLFPDTYLCHSAIYKVYLFSNPYRSCFSYVYVCVSLSFLGCVYLCIGFIFRMCCLCNAFIFRMCMSVYRFRFQDVCVCVSPSFSACVRLCIALTFFLLHCALVQTSVSVFFYWNHFLIFLTPPPTLFLNFLFFTFPFFSSRLLSFSLSTVFCEPPLASSSSIHCHPTLLCTCIR